MSDYTVDRTSHIDIVDNPDVKAFLDNCEYMKELEIAGAYVLNTVTKMSEKRIEEDIIEKSNHRWEGIS